MTPADSILLGLLTPPSWLEFGVILGVALGFACLIAGKRKP